MFTVYCKVKSVIFKLDFRNRSTLIFSLILLKNQINSKNSNKIVLHTYSLLHHKRKTHKIFGPKTL